MNTTNKQDKYSDGTYQHAVGKMVENEVKVCVSTLISDLCSAGLYDESCSFAELHYDILCQDDCEEAARDAGWNDNDGVIENPHTPDISYTFWEECCNEEGIEPYQREALEHWVVSDWLADRLLERGEMVDKDVHGLTVWGRTCSGQAILLDRVICDIYDEGMSYVE